MLEGFGLSQRASDISGALMEIAGYISHRRAGATAHLEGTGIAIGFGGAVAKCIAVVHGSSCVQKLIVRADIDVAFLVEDEVGPREVPSSRRDLSITGMCGSIFLALTSQLSVSAEPYAVSAAR